MSGPEHAPGRSPVESAPISEDALSVFIHEHADRALQGLLAIESATEQGLDRELTAPVVHDIRTSLRRLRAALRTFPDSFTPSTGVPGSADHDLRFVARTFGELRDTDVLTEGLLEQVEALPPSTVLGSVREELTDALTARRRIAIVHVAGRHGRARWRRALDQLRSWHQDPPRLVAPDPLHRLETVRDEVRERLRTAGGDPHALHWVRKAAKRWRYAAELLLPLEPAAAAHYERATGVHVRLGQLQDAVVAAGFLDELARSSDLSGPTATTIELLRRQAEQQIADIAAQAPQLLSAGREEAIPPRPDGDTRSSWRSDDS